MSEIKIGVFGPGGCEKTEITLRYLKNEYYEGIIPTITDEFSKVVEIDNKTISLSIIDTAGQDSFAEMRFSYYTKVHAAILVLDISNHQSIDDIKKIYADIQDCRDDDIVIAIAANKGYLRNENPSILISPNIYKELEKYFNCRVFETNVKTGTNITELFQYLIKRYLSTLSKEKFPKERKHKNSQIILPNNIQCSSPELLQKRSTSFVPKLLSKKRDGQVDSSSNFGSDIFGTPMGAEIKTILQSRTKQLQVALNEKKELEKKLKEKEAELQKAYEKIKDLEQELSFYTDNDSSTLFPRKSRNDDDDQNELKKSLKKSDIDEDDLPKIKKKSSRKSDLSDRRHCNSHKERRHSVKDISSDDDDKNSLKKLYKHENLSDDDQEELKKEKKNSSLRRKLNLSDSVNQEEYKRSKRKSSHKSNFSDYTVQDEPKKERKKSGKKSSSTKPEASTSDNKLTLDRLKELAHPSTSDVFSKKIRVFQPKEIDQLKKEKEIGRGFVDEVIKVTRKQIMAMIVFEFSQSSDAAKIVESGTSLNKLKIEQLLHNYELLNQLKHPNILKALGFCFGDDTHKPSMLFDYVQNSLRKIVSNLSNEEKVSLIIEIADALKCAHSLGIFNLNLNPDSVLVDSENHGKLSDFGISALIQFDSTEMIKKKFAQSLHFLAPEQILRNQMLDDKVDVYSFGMIVYYIVANGGLPNLITNDQDEVKIDLSSFPKCFNEYACALVMKCCAKNPDERPSFDDIVEAFDESFDLIDGVDIIEIRKRIQLIK